MNLLVNIEEIRARARKRIEDGAVTQDYGLDRERVIGILNAALATEIRLRQTATLSFLSATARDHFSQTNLSLRRFHRIRF